MKKLLCILSLLLCQCKTTVSGRIISSDKDEVFFHDGKINISSLSHEGVSEVVSIGENGYFEFEKDLKPGEYLVEPLIPGYQSTSMKIKVQKDKKLTIYARRIPMQSQQMIEADQNIREDIGSGDALIAPPKL